MMGPSRLLLVLDRAARAGTERHVLMLAEGLVARGWEVSLAITGGGPLLPLFAKAGVAAHRVARVCRPDPLYAIRLATLAREVRAQVLHAHSGRLAALAGRLGRIASVIETRHGLGSVGDPPVRRRLRREARMCRLAHRTVTVSESDRLLLIEAGLPARRVTCIPNGVPAPDGKWDLASRSSSVPGVIRLGFLGRLSPEKNPLFLLELARRLDERAPGRWELSIAGDGPQRAELESGLAGLGGRTPVIWLGETDGPDPLLREVDLLLVPSHREGQPLAVLEAMARGIPVIARDVAVLRELIGGSSPAGILLGDDPDEWARAIMGLADDPAGYRACALEGFARASSRHSVDRMVDSYASLYRESLAERGGVDSVG
jgi:glycosyltransferase involved in cell wall biosynthesis